MQSEFLITLDNTMKVFLRINLDKNLTRVKHYNIRSMEVANGLIYLT